MNIEKDKTEENKILISIIDLINSARPLPIREFDQIHMKSFDLLQQGIQTISLLEDKHVLFLGDGDGMSILFLKLFEYFKNYSYPKQLSVLDFDERILNKYKDVFNLSPLKHTIKLECMKYNVINPIPKSKEGKYDFFYINPPFGSKNNGNSCICWLYRCLEFCNTQCSGCIIIPCDDSREWTINSTYNIQKFLIENGFVIERIIHNFHEYYLDDDPSLKSSAFFVKRKFALLENKYTGKELPLELIKNLYGDPRQIPEYIMDDGTPFGKRDYNWRYGSRFV